MDMKTWAANEISLFKSKEGTSLYTASCCDPAFKAFKTLLEDGLSGMSIKVTQNILNRLINGEPLTPITDQNAQWDYSRRDKDTGVMNYQARRMSSLFKGVHPNGTVTYSDVNRHVKVDLDNESTWHSGLITNLGDKMFPITMPYYPATSALYRWYCRDILIDADNGDFDTTFIHYVVTPDGNKIKIDKCFSSYFDGKMRELSPAEFKTIKNLIDKKNEWADLEVTEEV